MTDNDRELVRLTNAGSQIEANALRDFLESNGVYCYVEGQQTSSVFGAAGVVLVEMNLMVAREDLERARELLVAFQQAEPVLDDDAGWDDEDEDEEQPGAQLAPMRRQFNRRKAAMLAFLPSFGSAHIYTGAWGRGLLLAAVQLCGMAMWPVYPMAALLLPLAVLVDLVGGTSRVRELRKPAIPAAKAVSRKAED